jgi:hypothetical protein
MVMEGSGSRSGPVQIIMDPYPGGTKEPEYCIILSNQTKKFLVRPGKDPKPRNNYLLRLTVWADGVSLHGEGDLAPDTGHLLLGEGGEGPHLTRHHSPCPCVLSCPSYI